jgi:hypothetical protein
LWHATTRRKSSPCHCTGCSRRSFQRGSPGPAGTSVTRRKTPPGIHHLGAVPVRGRRATPGEPLRACPGPLRALSGQRPQCGRLAQGVRRPESRLSPPRPHAQPPPPPEQGQRLGRPDPRARSRNRLAVLATGPGGCRLLASLCPCARRVKLEVVSETAQPR